MKELKCYGCEICSQTYFNKKKALNCEKFHNSLKIEKVIFKEVRICWPWFQYVIDCVVYAKCKLPKEKSRHIKFNGYVTCKSLDENDHYISLSSEYICFEDEENEEFNSNPNYLFICENYREISDILKTQTRDFSCKLEDFITPILKNIKIELTENNIFEYKG